MGLAEKECLRGETGQSGLIRAEPVVGIAWERLFRSVQLSHRSPRHPTEFHDPGLIVRLRPVLRIDDDAGPAVFAIPHDAPKAV
jgi:hypothetical protein